MRSILKLMVIFFISILVGAAQCDTPLVDRQTEFFISNRSPSTILIHVGLAYEGFQAVVDGGRTLPINESTLMSLAYDPIPSAASGYIAISTQTNNIFDELPDRLLRIWVFQESIFNTIPYDSIRQSPDLFELVTLTENEYEMMGDTLIIN